MSCAPCRETPECMENDDEEHAALMDLYARLFESKRAEACCPADAKSGGGGGGGGGPRSGQQCGCRLPPSDETTTPPPTKRPAAAAAAEYCPELTADGTRMKRFDRQLTALLRRQPHRDGDDTGAADAAAEGDVKHLTAQLPAFRSCTNRKPGAVNASLFGLDLEQWMTGAGTAGDGRDDDVKRAAYDLAAAEARCKYYGAVEAAERAVHVEPAGHLAEVAASYGARSYAGNVHAGAGTGRDAGGDSPVVVVAYIGNTGPAPPAPPPPPSDV